MSKLAIIPITTSDCIQSYRIEYKREWERDYILLEGQTESPLTIPGLDASTGYNVRITALCCNGKWSPTSATIITTPA